MAMHPDPSIPLLASDQAEVIQIFLELMLERAAIEQASEVATTRPRRSRKPSNRARFAEPPDFE
jgi:nitrogen-specific signal transduction histidine kinase